MDPGMTSRSRNLNVQQKFNPGYRKLDFSSDWHQFSPAATNSFQGTQYTESEGHVKSHDGKYHEGGPFFTYRIEPTIPGRNIKYERQGNDGRYYKYNGPIYCPLVPSNLSEYNMSIPKSDSSYLDPIGARAISAVDPTNPNAELGVALGEIIKDRKVPIPVINLWKAKTKLAKAASGEYLNAVFGWLPLVSDMKDTAQSVLDGNAIMENYRNASGTHVHREFEFPLEKTVSSSTLSESAAANVGNVALGPGGETGGQSVIRQRESTTRRWFSGSFTYHSGGGTHLQKCLGIGSEAEKLFGLSLTPDVIWELSPWSWAVDWFSNAGSVISNVTSLGIRGLVMPYAYIMEETSIVDTYTMSGTGISGVLGTVPPCTITYKVKRRREANPFGFGLSWDGLSPTQLAITAALGITRLR